MYQAGLVLEGGGMKGIYTAGVLEFFWKRKLSFLPVMGYRPGHVICAAFYPNKRNGHTGWR